MSEPRHHHGQSRPASTSAANEPASLPSAPAPEIPDATALSPVLDTCWNRIGVYGDRKCEELPKVVHCRNCAVYSRAARQLLDRPLPVDYRAQWTVHYAQEQAPEEGVRVSAVLFRIGHEWFALPTYAFQEIAEKRPIHSLPHRQKDSVLGIANVRGELLICISLSRFLNRATGEGSNLRRNYTRLVVTQSEDGRFLFPVDEVQGIYRFPQRQLSDPLSGTALSGRTYMAGIFQWRRHTVGLLEPTRLFPALQQNLS